MLWVKKLTFFVCFNYYHVSHPLLMLESVFIYLSIKYLKCVLVSLYVYFEKVYGIIIMTVFQYIRTFFLRGRSNRDSDLKGRQEAKRQTAAMSVSSVLPCYSWRLWCLLSCPQDIPAHSPESSLVCVWDIPKLEMSLEFFFFLLIKLDQELRKEKDGK